MSPELDTVLVAVVTAVAAALPGTLLVLRRVAMVSDAISHSILPGIVLAFFVTGSLTSPLLLVAAAATGVLAVLLIEIFAKSGLVAEDAATGLVFPALFSIGVILVSRAAGDVHLDTDSVLLGELAFAPLDRLTLAGADLGPRSLWSMGAILVINALALWAANKELKLATVDPGLAAALGFSPAVLHYGLMALVSVTAVGAFNAVGSILVVALMIAPPATAYLLVERFVPMLWTSAAIAAASAVAGYGVAYFLDTSIAGAMACATGAFFAIAFLAAPRRGLLAQARRRRGQRTEFAVRMLLVHLLHHEHGEDASEERRLDTLNRHLRWSELFTRQVVRHAEGSRLVRRHEELLDLTDGGRELAQRLLIEGPRAV